MSCSSARRFVHARPFLLAAAASAAAFASASPAFAAGAEQVNRADGSTGAFPLETSSSSNTAISDDGRFAFHQFSTNRGPWTSARGVYRRDIATNKTVAIATGDARLTGATADGSGASFVTAAKLDPADTNGRPDLYGYVASTGKTILLSRYDGATGAAIGVTSGAYITRGGRYALFGTAIGIGKRDLTTGKTVKVADGPLGEAVFGGVPQWNVANLSASADGSVFRSADKIVTPTASYGADGFYDRGTGIVVSDSGAYAAFVAGDSIRRMDTATGAVSNRAANGLYGVRHVADDGNMTVASAIAATNGVEYSTLNFASGATTPTGLKMASSNRFTAVSPSAKFGLFISSSSDRVLWAIAAPGSVLPGAADDLPSPHVYVDLTPACKSSGWGPYVTPGSVSINNYRPEVPKPTSVTVDLYTSAGTFVQRISAAGPDTANTGSSAYKTVTTVKYADGRTATESWTQRAMGSSDTCGTF